MVLLLLTTNPGIEDIVVWEASYRLGAKLVEARELRGRVIVEVDSDNLYMLEYMRSIHRPRILLYYGKVCSERKCMEEALYEAVYSARLEEYISTSSTFAVRAERAGSHEYTSIDIASTAGRLIQNYFMEKYRSAPRVDLDYPSTIVSVDVIFDDMYLSLELGGDLSWHRRGYRVYDHPAALKPTLAFAMLVIAGVRDGESLLDPMCGGGTIPIEAALVFESSRLYCSDKNPRHIEGAILNAQAAMVRNRIEFSVLDARHLSTRYRKVDYVVSNPPYGVRMGSPKKIANLYRDFIYGLEGVLERKAVLITTEYEKVKEYARDIGWKTYHERTVAHGGLWLKIVSIGS